MAEEENTEKGAVATVPLTHTWLLLGLIVLIQVQL
jgi:hypothetical protein